VQAGFADGTDTGWVKSVISNPYSVIYPEIYKLKLAVSPHIAAEREGITISTEKIFSAYSELILSGSQLIIEGAGGLMVPLNENEFVLDLIKKMNAKVILVSRNYLGSINHSLLTAQICRQKGIKVAGWIFTDSFMDYENDIARWSGYPKITSVPKMPLVDKLAISAQAARIKEDLLRVL
jgi:dethiobiotin synthetase